jgi:hypothetical protein
MFFYLSGFSQKMSVNEIMSNFEGKEGVTSMVLSKDLMSLAANIKTDDADFNNLIKGIAELKILVLEKATQVQKDSFHSMVKMLPVSDYKELMTVKDGKQLVKMIVKENGGKITDFLLVVTGDNEPVLINITGTMDVKKLSGLGKKMNLAGCKHLAKLDKK